MTATRIIIDTDPGIDDAMAILHALAAPQIELVGLTTIFGNVPIATATRNALQLLELAGAEVPVAEGAARPLLRAPAPPADFVHGTEGFGEEILPPPRHSPDTRSAARFIIDALRANPGEITLVPVGPLTNIALALREAPEIAGLVREVVVMGGAVRTPGNVTPHAEANIWHDPDAAAEVFAADWPVRLIGLDVTEKVRCTAADFAPMRDASPRCGAFLAQAAGFYFAFHRESDGFDGCYLHDPTAVIAATDPGLFETVTAPLTVVTEGERIGETRERPGAGPAVTCAIGVDAAAIRARFLGTLHSRRLP